MLTGLILKTHDYLMRHKGLALLVAVAGMAVCVALGLRLDFKENIADFLPKGGDNGRYASVYEDMGDGGRITIIFRAADTIGDKDVELELMEAVDLFSQCWQTVAVAAETNLQCGANDMDVIEALDYLRDNVALFLTVEDYARMDSLLEQPGYVDTCMSHVRRMMAFPMSGVAIDAVRNDPLNLFSPVLQRLQRLAVSDNYEVRDGYLFDAEGRAYAFMTSPYPASDTRGNSRLAALVGETADTVMNRMPGVRVSAVGAPLIAATNAKRIKSDSLWAGMAAVVMILVILYWSMGYRRNILWLGLSVVAGWLFALGVAALLRPAISIIVIGIGSVLVGIAVNYPLHYLEHIREHPDRRESLKDMVEPLVTGNITTVSAFACLLFVKAEAMRDLGLFGSLMLVGTIIFVMVFLPLVAKSGNRRNRKYELKTKKQADAHSRIHAFTHLRIQTFAHSRLFIVVVAVLTVVLGFLGRNTRFDDDLHNINYMTAEQREDLEVLSRSLGDTDSSDLIYWVAESKTLDDALRLGEEARVGDSGGRLEASYGAAALLPSECRQRESLEAWHRFMEGHPRLDEEVARAAARCGFAPGAFSPFAECMCKEYGVISPERMELLCSLAGNYILPTDTSVRVVGMVRVPTTEAEGVKQAWAEQWRGQTGLYAFDMGDMGSSLVSALNDDFNYILYVCGVVVFFFLWVSMGRLELALLAFLPLAVGWLWILGLMDLAGVGFNIVNIILATFIFGQGDDYSIFITEGLMHDYAYGRQRLPGYRRSVVVSALLMFAGMGVLLFARHPAMRSLAEVAVIGMAVVIVMACLLPPVVFGWMTHKGGKVRQVPVTLKRLLYTAVSLLVLLLAATVVVTPLTLVYRLVGRDGRDKRLRYHGMICRFCRIGMRLLPGVGHTLRNPYGEDFSKPAVIIANHQSHLDLICMLMLTPKLVVLTNDWVWRNPLYGVIIRYAEYLPVSRGYEALLPQLRRLVGDGYSVLVFPEGTRSEDGTVGRFHKGAFLLARELGLDVLPVFLHGVQHVMPKEELLLREGRITTIVERRIPCSEFAGTDLREAASRMRSHYRRHYAELRRELEDEEYWEPMVRYQYLYKGREVSRRCRQALRGWKEGLRNRDATNDVGQGELVLLAALAHPEKEYHCRFDNADDYLVARHCALVPSNLHYELSDGSGSQELEIRSREGGGL